MKAFATRFIANIAQKRAIDKTLSELVGFLSKTSPQEIYYISLQGKPLEEYAPSNVKEKYMTRLKGIKTIVDRFGTQHHAVKLVEEIDFKTFLKEIHDRVLEEAENGNRKAVENLTFILNTPVCLRWLKANFEALKGKVIAVLKGNSGGVLIRTSCPKDDSPLEGRVGSEVVCPTCKTKYLMRQKS